MYKYILTLAIAIPLLACASQERPHPKFFGAAFPGEKRSKTSAQDRKEIQQAQQWAIKNYQLLSANDCRPPIRLTEKGDDYESLPGIITTSPSGQIACMLAGYKDIYLGYQDDLKSISEEIKKELDKMGVKQIIFGDNFILYTPKGEKNAKLLKLAVTGRKTDFLLGYLLGYSLADIMAYYLRLNAIEQYEKDQEDTLNWIKQQSE